MLRYFVLAIQERLTRQEETTDEQMFGSASPPEHE